MVGTSKIVWVVTAGAKPYHARAQQNREEKREGEEEKEKRKGKRKEKKKNFDPFLRFSAQCCAVLCGLVHAATTSDANKKTR